MVASLEYAAGETNHQEHLIVMSFPTNWSHNKRCLKTRWVEFWCSEYNQDIWRVEETSNQLIVSFNSIYDATFFKMGPEFVDEIAKMNFFLI